VLSAITLPRTVLLLLGGAVGDRIGARKVMITGDAIMLLVAAMLAILSWRWGTPLPLLVFAGLLIGTVDAFYLPSTGSMPRRLVDDSQLARAVALRQGGSQLVSLVGGPIGGALVAVAGMAAASLADSFTFAVVLVALIAIRPRFTPPPIDQRRNLLRDAVDGIRVAVTTPGLGAALVLVAGPASSSPARRCWSRCSPANTTGPPPPPGSSLARKAWALSPRPSASPDAAACPDPELPPQSAYSSSRQVS
jgi:MFS family permease